MWDGHLFRMPRDGYPPTAFPQLPDSVRAGNASDIRGIEHCRKALTFSLSAEAPQELRRRFVQQSQAPTPGLWMITRSSVARFGGAPAPKAWQSPPLNGTSGSKKQMSPCSAE